MVFMCEFIYLNRVNLQYVRVRYVRVRYVRVRVQHVQDEQLWLFKTLLFLAVKLMTLLTVSSMSYLP